MKGGKRKRKDGEFVVPSVKEVAHDRNHYIETRTVEIIKAADKMKMMLHNLQYFASRVKLRKVLLDEYDKRMDDRMENLDGVRKPKDMIEAEYNIDVHTHNTQFREYTRMREMFIKEYHFEEETVIDILNGKFDFNAWQDQYLNDNLIKLSPEEVKKNEEVVKLIEKKNKDKTGK